LDAKYLEVLEKDNIKFTDVLREHPLNEKYYSIAREYSEPNFEEIGSREFLVYAENAVLNYLKIAIQRRYPHTKRFLRYSFGYPGSDVKKETILKAALEALPKELRENVSRRIRIGEQTELIEREKEHSEIVEKLLAVLNKDIIIDKNFKIHDEEGKIKSEPDLHITLKDRGLEGVIELKTTTDAFKEFADAKLLGQLVQYCGNYKFVWLLTTTDLEFSKILDLTGKESGFATGWMGIPGREMRGRKIVEAAKDFMKKKEEQYVMEFDSRSLTARVIGNYLIGRTPSHVIDKILEDYESILSMRGDSGRITRSSTKLERNDKRYKKSLYKKKVLYLHSADVKWLLKPGLPIKTDKGDEGTDRANMYKALMKKYDLILIITELKKFIDDMLLVYDLREDYATIKRLARRLDL